MTIDGEVAFSIVNGVTTARLLIENHDDLTVDAIFGITLEVQYDKTIEGFKKQIAAVPVSPFTIPGIITLGPQVSITGTMDLVLNGKAELLVGGSFKLTKGTMILDAIDKDSNELDGLVASFTPVFQFTGTITASIEFGLPVAFEVGLDVLNGKWKATVGAVEKPIIYASATVTNDKSAPCQDGVQLRAGVKNRLYFSALEKWDYDVRTDIIYERGIGCLRYGSFHAVYRSREYANVNSKNGFDTSDVAPAQGVIEDIIKAVGGTDVADTPIPLNDVAATIQPPNNDTGFRLIMDYDKTTVLVAGKDGYIYLVPANDIQNDVSAPWGSINLTTPGVNLDVFGRVMSYLPDKGTRLTAEVRVWTPDNAPANFRAG